MNLNYEKIKAKVEHGSHQWTSYSDLFLVLSVVFLLLFVVANLRSGTGAIMSQTQVQTMKAENDDLKKQIKAYEALRDGYLKEGASQDEVKVYQELMGKLTLLEDEAKSERKELFKKAQDAQEKEQQLNHYQALVKNIISANLVASARVKKRDVTIQERDTEIVAQQDVITQKDKELGDLNRTVASKQAEITRNNVKIGEIEEKLEERIKQVREAYKSKHKSESMLKDAIAKMREESNEQINSLISENTKFVGQLQSAQDKIAEQNRQSERLLADLNAKEQKYKATVEELDRAHQAAVAREKAAFEKGMEKAKLSAEAKLAQEREFRAGLERKNSEYNAKLAGLKDQLEATRGNIKSIEGKYQASMSAMQRNNEELARNLKASENKLQEQRRLAEKIKGNFKRAGIDADVDLKTGDVMIQFKDEYFDTGSANLKPGMKNTIEHMMPVYAKSLFQDQKIASRISSVEIVGFASPTYQGKFVNPESLSPEDRAAVNYNMDLSYQRAKGIFEYVFDTKKIDFPDQKRLLPLVKVSGRSYLTSDSKGRDPASSKSDYKKSQRVIIKFNLKDE